MARSPYTLAEIADRLISHLACEAYADPQKRVGSLGLAVALASRLLETGNAMGALEALARNVARAPSGATERHELCKLHILDYE